jgi:hypothetical protein
MGDDDVSNAPPSPPMAGEAPGAKSFPRWLKWFIGVSAVVVAIGLAGTLIRLP